MDVIWEVSSTFMCHYSDKRIGDFPLMDNVFGLCIIIVSYLLFVLKVGPALMRDRTAFKLRPVLLAFNAVQIVVCLYIITQILLTLPFSEYKCLTNQSTSPQDLLLVKVSYYYWILKVVDLLDTVFFVLRKKSAQVSMLHVYHHTLMVTAGWLLVKHYPAGELVIIGLINCVVHVFMYFYYFCSVLFDGRINLWWKKYITQCQLLQFIILLIVYGIKLFDASCGYPKGLLMFHLVQVMIMVYLFGKFYFHAYLKLSKHPEKLY